MGRVGRGPRLDPELLRRATPSLLVTAGSVALVVAIVWLVGSLESRAASYRGGEPVVIEFDWPMVGQGSRAMGIGAEDGVDKSTGSVPEESWSWLPEQFRRSLLAEAQAAVGPDPDPFSIAPLARLSRALKGSGWFDGEPRVERVDPQGQEDEPALRASIRVTGTWRRPAALVRVGERDLLIDDRGRRMPVEYPAGREDQTTRVILGVRAEAPRGIDGSPDYESVWASDRIEASIALLEVLRPQEFWPQVAGIDASRFAGRGGMLVIVTDRGSRIEWGSRPDRFAPGEVTVREKLARLASFYADPALGHIDAGREGYKLYTPEVELPAR